MSSSYGENIRLTVFGQSHSEAVGMTLEGIPAGKRIDEERIRAFLLRRAPGQNALSTQRKEADEPHFICGIKNGVSCGAPITAIIKNTDARPSDYEALSDVPRPGHADYTADVKYRGSQDRSGGGHFSGRLTAPMCIAGGICIQLLEEYGIKIISRILSIGDVRDEGELTVPTSEKDFPTVDGAAGARMCELIAKVKRRGDSVGGVIECAVTGLPAGIGDPIFGGMENRVSAAVFGIPAVKGIEFGAGFAAASMLGSENNDPFTVSGGRIVTKTNNCGGILGGITNGMPLVFRAAVKPTPSIGVPQRSVNIKTMEETEISVPGRHDPCIVPRAVPCVESAAALAVYDALLSGKKEV